MLADAKLVGGKGQTVQPVQLSNLPNIFPAFDDIIVQLIPLRQGGQLGAGKPSNGTEVQPPYG